MAVIMAGWCAAIRMRMGGTARHLVSGGTCGFDGQDATRRRACGTDQHHRQREHDRAGLKGSSRHSDQDHLRLPGLPVKFYRGGPDGIHCDPRERRKLFCRKLRNDSKICEATFGLPIASLALWGIPRIIAATLGRLFACGAAHHIGKSVRIRRGRAAVMDVVSPVKCHCPQLRDGKATAGMS